MGTPESTERGRRARNIFISSAVLIISWALLSIWLIHLLIANTNNDHWVSLIIVVVCLTLGLLITIKNLVSLFLANESIFPGSGQPIPMLNKLYESLALNSQTNLALFTVALISILMVEKVVSSEAGMPIISAVIGYTVAKNIHKESKEGEKHGAV